MPQFRRTQYLPSAKGVMWTHEPAGQQGHALHLLLATGRAARQTAAFGDDLIDNDERIRPRRLAVAQQSKGVVRRRRDLPPVQQQTASLNGLKRTVKG